MPKILLGVSSSFCANFLRGQVDFLVKHGFEVIGAARVKRSASGQKESAVHHQLHRDHSAHDLLQRCASLACSGRNALLSLIRQSQIRVLISLCRLAGIKTRYYTSGFCPIKGLLRQLITLQEMSCSMANRVIVVSQTLKLHAEKRNILKKGKGIVLKKGSANGIDLHLFPGKEAVSAASRQLRDTLGLKKENLVLGFVGRLSKDKGIDILFEAFNALAKDHPSLRMVIAGPIIEENLFSRHWLHQLYHDERIVYVGAIRYPPFTALWTYGLPSFREGFPIAY